MQLFELCPQQPAAPGTSPPATGIAPRSSTYGSCRTTRALRRLPRSAKLSCCFPRRVAELTSPREAMRTRVGRLTNGGRRSFCPVWFGCCWQDGLALGYSLPVHSQSESDRSEERR